MYQVSANNQIYFFKAATIAAALKIARSLGSSVVVKLN